MLLRICRAAVIAAIGLATAPAVLASSTADEDANLIPANATRGGAFTSSYRTADEADGLYRVSTRFRTFSGETLSIGFELPDTAGRASLREFGVSDQELKTLLDACMARQHCEQDEFDQETARYYREHALRMRIVPGQKTHLYVDIAQVVQRNRARVQPVAAALRRVAAEHGHDTRWTINAAIALVQTGLLYRKPSQSEDGRQILGFYPPPRALERGYGDCDTKAALLAAILQNLTDTPIIGVHVPQHYLLGIAIPPAADQATLRYDGKPFVLVEASGPGERPPGDIGSTTQLALDSMNGVRIDPMF
ncbi:hypothetical protein [Solimonas terrae]|uniref:Transglutaminase domain-containing protein n=1 Tax=Solimonas terrae TaxID=1396819 RepID=A0A6M2BVZ1_9GAMM|nr:hypothetical protein [Solimonas terrae]NGY06381.1 hypothetical protein [Solimonas terrae]